MQKFWNLWCQSFHWWLEASRTVWCSSEVFISAEDVKGPGDRMQWNNMSSWNQTGLPIHIFLLSLQCVCFHPNSNYVATGSCDRMIKVWDILNGKCVRVMTGHKVSYKFAFWKLFIPFYIHSSWNGSNFILDNEDGLTVHMSPLGRFTFYPAQSVGMVHVPLVTVILDFRIAIISYLAVT